MDNERRIDLIEKRHLAGLTDDEIAELAGLQKEAERMVDDVEQLPVEGAEALLARLMQNSREA